MIVNNPKEDKSPSKSSEEAESPRKHLDSNSSRKSWSLMDRKADQEVLQEMGVGLLDPDELEVSLDVLMHHHRPSLKRKHNIENVSPNVLNYTSPRKHSAKKVCSPTAGPSKAWSPRSCESVKPLTETYLSDNSLISDFIIEEETPLAQSVSAEYLVPGYTNCGKRAARCMPLGQEEEKILTKWTKWEPCGSDSFRALSDEVMLSVFKWLPKRTLAHCMMVCKRWYRVACDETLWQRLDLGNKTLSKDALGMIIARKPIIVRLASSEIGEWHPTSNPEPSRIQYLDLSMSTIGTQTLNHLLARCPALKKLSLENLQLDDTTCEFIGKCSNLEALNLTMAQGLTPEGVNHILKGCKGLQYLNISWCGLCEESLHILVKNLPQMLQRLNIGGARLMTNEMLDMLSDRCPRLVELDVSDCSRLSASAVTSALKLTRLDHLAVSRCYLLSVSALAELNRMCSLQYLEVWGMLQPQSLAILRTALSNIRINQYMFSAIARPTVGTRRTSIWGLRTRD